MTKIGVIFDMDGVIVNNHPYHYQAWEMMCRKYGHDLNETDYMHNMNGRTLEEVVNYIFGEKKSKAEILKIGAEKEAIYRKIYQPFLEPTLGFLPFLSELTRANVPLAIGTSAPIENVDFTIKGLGIGHNFNAVLDSRAVTKGKPNPEIYQKCASAIGLPNEQCIVFEDAISGIKAGKAAGSKVIALATSHRREELEADLVIDDFTGISLKQLIDLVG